MRSCVPILAAILAFSSISRAEGALAVVCAFTEVANYEYTLNNWTRSKTTGIKVPTLKAGIEKAGAILDSTAPDKMIFSGQPLVEIENSVILRTAMKPPNQVCAVLSGEIVTRAPGE